MPHGSYGVGGELMRSVRPSTFAEAIGSGCPASALASRVRFSSGPLPVHVECIDRRAGANEQPVLFLPAEAEIGAGFR